MGKNRTGRERKLCIRIIIPIVHIAELPKLFGLFCWKWTGGIKTQRTISLLTITRINIGKNEKKHPVVGLRNFKSVMRRHLFHAQKQCKHLQLYLRRVRDRVCSSMTCHLWSGPLGRGPSQGLSDHHSTDRRQWHRI